MCKFDFVFFVSRRTHSLDKEVNASGFSKEIQEFDKLVSEMNREAEEEVNNEQGDENNNDEPNACNDSNNNEQDDESNREAEEKYARSILESEENSSSPKKNESKKSAEQKDAVPELDDDVPEGEEDDKFDDTMLNKQFRPYRDQKPDDDEESESGSENEDNCSVTSYTSTIMDPKMVRSKVKQSLLKRMKAEKRRIRNKGESAMVTNRIREVNDTIKSSMGFF